MMALVNIKITLVYLTPTTFFVFIMSIINSSRVFREIYIISGSYPHESIAEDIAIVSPCNGSIKDIGFERGTFTTFGTALFSIVDVSKGLQFRASVNNESLMRLKQND